MNYLNMALGAAGGAAGGWAGGRPQQMPRPGERRDQGALMQYLRRKANPVNGAMPTEPGLPPGAMPPPGPVGPMAPAPQQQNPYENPYPRRPPMVDGGPTPPAYGQQFAQGGIVDKPTTAIIGEDGPEMVVPLSGRPDAKVSPRNLGPSAKQLAGMDQQQLADLARRDPQLASQLLLMRQGLTTNTDAPPGAPPRYTDTYLGRPRQDVASPTGHPMGQAPLASGDAPQFQAMQELRDANVISTMGNALGNKMSGQAQSNQQAAIEAERLRKQRPQMSYGR